MHPMLQAPDATWTARQRQYILWRALEPSQRPENLPDERAIAHYLGVSIAQLHEWHALPGFWDEVYQATRAIIGAELPAILRAIVASAKRGHVGAQKLALQVLGVYRDVSEHKVTTEKDQLVIVMPQRPDAPPTQDAPPARAADAVLPAVPS